jgi:hypothetical protein
VVKEILPFNNRLLTQPIVMITKIHTFVGERLPHMQLLAKILAFYLLLGSSMPGMDYCQLTRIQNAVRHFKLHKTEAAADGENLSFYSFFFRHYIQPDDHEHQDQQNNHQNLPLTSIHVDISFVLFFHPLLNVAPPAQAGATPQFTDQAIIPEYFSSVFRPPVV